MRTHLTVGECAELFGVTPSQVRRVVDSLGADIPRAGQYRLIPRTALPALAAALQARGFIQVPEVAGS